MPEAAAAAEIEIESSRWTNNPEFLEDIHDGNIDCAKPELASVRNEDGSTVICGVADAATVKVPVEDNPDHLCLKDYQGRIRLHSAAENGDEEGLRSLLAACPNSIEVLTSQSETALHLAVKNDHPRSFQVLVEHCQKHDFKELINRQDDEGNTVLHIATAREQKQIVQQLVVSCKSRSGDDVVGLNSTNKMGFTALDLYYQGISYSIDKNIGDILREAGGKKGQELRMCEGQPSLSQPGPRILEKMMHENIDLVMKSLLLMVFIFIADAAHDSLFNLSNIYPLDHHVEIVNFSVEDIIRSPNILPEVFYVLVANTITFLGSMFVILVNTWSIATKWSLCYRVAPLLVTVAMLVSYGLAVKKIMPKFWVTIATHKIPSFWVAWFCIPLLFSSVAAFLIGKQIFCIFSKLGYRKG